MSDASASTATTSFSSWDFHNFRVQQELVGGQFVSAESTLVGAGPPSMPADATADGTVYPIGILETMGLQQSKQLQRIFEIGSSRSYFIPGRVIGSITLGRTFYFGPSLLRVLYAYYQSNGPTGVEIGTEGKDAKIPLAGGVDGQHPKAKLLEVYDGVALHQVRRSPGEDYLFIDLASDLFAQPFGMAVYFKDANFNSVGAMYLEQAYIQGHQMTISSGSVLIMEGASAQYDRIVPIKMLNG